MTRRPLLAVLWSTALVVAVTAQGADDPRPSDTSTLHTALDATFDDPLLARALVAARFESLRDRRLVYARNSNKLVVPASVLKLVTVAVAADRLGWDFRFVTRLEFTGTVTDGMLDGDLIVTGAGDPSIGSPDGGHPQLFLEWADALRAMNIRRVQGRLIGDDNVLDDEGIGAGWAWDYLSAGYAAPSGALSYNENVAVVRVAPGVSAGSPAAVALTPPGHRLDVQNAVTTATAGQPASVTLSRLAGSPRLLVQGQVPAGGPTLVRTAAVDNPTRTFVESLHLALASRGIQVTRGAWDIDDLAAPLAATPRRLVAVRESAPLSSLAGYALKMSQNLYGEVFLKVLGREGTSPGTAEGGRQAVRGTLETWGIPADAVVMYDGSGLSRYNYVTADALTSLLGRVWDDARLRGPFLAALPVGGHDGTLETRMRSNELTRRVQAKTGTITNVRSLAGYLDTLTGEKVAFTIIVNNFTAPVARIDEVVERALARVITASPAAR